MAKALATFSRPALAQQLQKLLAQDAYLAPLVDQAMQEQLLTYLELMHKWNQAFNLTAIKDPSQMLVKHLLDSLAVAPSFANYNKVLDVGTGAGLPGIPLAILFAKVNPHMHFTLLDSLGKRIQFLRQVLIHIPLPNVTIVHSPVEDYHEEQFDCITSRAFTALDRMTLVCEHLLAPNGNYVLLKSSKVDEEAKTLPAQFKIEQVTGISVPGLEDNERYIVVVSRN
ncbi:16S rRNA (guanine(527)-N(7))-methyltransferase RsmG [Psittacicella hinzii]|uniref:Ribosomal RNA small subunit methyltransferase G n=1 Tax=Psittacicella hinzii TaxID=2028575 RepID=A0A3A1YJA2_9GAMM|nr:16S rRNA (guanine(527)-N(7))-methyltransferase RsmG [Psittacicella hinzii]RIY37130.1 16S rRNA (guanine(527)-N(7))-methyltransferase RsmG [Psittacicella hinzii]